LETACDILNIGGRGTRTQKDRRRATFAPLARLRLMAYLKLRRWALLFWEIGKPLAKLIRGNQCAEKVGGGLGVALAPRL